MKSSNLSIEDKVRQVESKLLNEIPVNPEARKDILKRIGQFPAEIVEFYQLDFENRVQKLPELEKKIGNPAGYRDCYNSKMIEQRIIGDEFLQSGQDNSAGIAYRGFLEAAEVPKDIAMGYLLVHLADTFAQLMDSRKNQEIDYKIKPTLLSLASKYLKEIGMLDSRDRHFISSAISKFYEKNILPKKGVPNGMEDAA